MLLGLQYLIKVKESIGVNLLIGVMILFGLTEFRSLVLTLILEGIKMYYVKVNGYTYECYDDLSKPRVGDLAILPPNMYTGGTSVGVITQVRVTKPTDYGGPFKSVEGLISLSDLFEKMPEKRQIEFLVEEAEKLGYTLKKGVKKN
jgi:hypothetical protein